MHNGISTLKWYCKKCARQLVSRASVATGLLDDNDQVEPLVRVLTYHRFGDETRNPFCISAMEFERQIEYIARNDLAIGLDLLETFISGGGLFDGTRILITIDDGFRSTYSIALPILQKYGIPSIAFVSPALIEDRYLSRHAPEPYLSWDEISAISTTNMQIGSHSMLHRSYGTMTLSDATADARDSREILDQYLSYGIRSFAYPYGTQADFSEVTTKAIVDGGYSVAFTSQHGAILPSTDPYLLPRIKIERGDSLESFRLMVHGAMDSWRYIDRYLWRLQARQ